MANDYKTELDYQLDLVRATAPVPVPQQLADGLIECATLEAQGRLARAARDERIARLQALAIEINGDMHALEQFRWAYILYLLRARAAGVDVAGTAHDICVADLPSLVQHLGVTLSELREVIALSKGKRGDY